MIPEARATLARMRSALGAGNLLSRVDRWLEENTFLDKAPFSFSDHEFQIGIARDISHEKVVKKCSQVGLSELEVRIMLALLSISDRWRGIFVLPTARFASKFAKDRFDPVIEESPILSSSLIKAADSSEMKRIGGSTLYIGGAVGAKAAISIPATVLFVDELDFCDQTTVAAYSSRLRHAENGGFKHKFSTPTVSGYGISAEFELSDKKYYTVKCKHCNERQVVDHFAQMVIPGYDGAIEDFEKADLAIESYRVKDAYLACTKCGKDLLRSLMDPSCREWVAAHPGRDVSGYQVSPYDLIKYNTPPRVIAQLSDYKRKKDYYNNVLGLDYSAPDSQIMDEILQSCVVLPFMKPGSVQMGECYLGVDVGKTAHWALMTPRDRELHFVAFGTFSTKDGQLAPQITALAKMLGAYVVIDAHPDFTTAQQVVDDMDGEALAAVYTKTSRKASLSYFEAKEEEGTVVVERTALFDQFVESVNTLKMKFCKSEEMPTVSHHYQQMRRVEQMNAEGEMVPTWVKLSGDDHFLHASAFAMLGWELNGAGSGVAAPAINLNVGGVSIGGTKVAPAVAQKIWTPWSETPTANGGLFGLSKR